MTDDVKGFRERITAAMERIAAGHSPMRIPADMTDPDIVLSDCLAHIEGEASRTAAAVAAAREEQRQACALVAAQWARESGLAYGEPSHLFDAVMAAPLTETPLADELERSWQETSRMVERAEKAEAERDRLAGDALAALAGAGVATPQEGYTTAPFLLKGDIGRLVAERDALRAQVAEATERLDEFGSQATLADGIQAMRLRLVKLRAQVEAARAWVTQRVGVEGLNDMLAETAMDGAKP